MEKRNYTRILFPSIREMLSTAVAEAGTRDAYRFPTRGTIVEFQTEYITKALGSYEDYLRFSLGGSHYVFGTDEEVEKFKKREI